MNPFSSENGLFCVRPTCMFVLRGYSRKKTKQRYTIKSVLHVCPLFILHGYCRSKQFIKYLKFNHAVFCFNFSFKSNATRVSSIFRDSPRTPVEVAVDWMEYVVRHNGAKHLRSAALDLNIFQYFLLDVICTVVLGLFILFGFLLCLCRSCFYGCRKFYGWSAKQKTDWLNVSDSQCVSLNIVRKWPIIKQCHNIIHCFQNFPEIYEIFRQQNYPENSVKMLNILYYGKYSFFFTGNMCILLVFYKFNTRK